MTAPRILKDGPLNRIQLPFDGSLLIREYDFCYLASGKVLPVSSLADGGTLALNQAAGAAAFIGIAMDSRNAADTAAVTDFPVCTDFLADYDCASTTWAVDDLIGLVEDAGTGTFLEKQIVAKVTDPSSAIGRCMLAATSATRVRGLFRANKLVPGGIGVGSRAVQVMTVDGAVTIKDGTVMLNKAGVLAATLADAIATVDDGKVLQFIAMQAQANTVTIASGLNGVGASKDVATFGGAIGDTFSVRAYQGKWYLLSATNVTFG